MIKIAGLLLLITLCACSHFGREISVVNVTKTSTPATEAIKTARHQLLQNKNSLRIAILTLGLKTKRELSGRAIIMTTEMMTFLDNPLYDWKALSLARLHQQLIPELYQLLSLVSEKKIPLYVICESLYSCDLLRQNMGRKDLKRVTFLKKYNHKVLGRIRPLLVLATGAKYFEGLSDNSKWTHWKTEWISLANIDRTSQLYPQDWARVVPTIHEF